MGGWLKLLKGTDICPGYEIHESRIGFRSDAQFSFCSMFVILCVLREHGSVTQSAFFLKMKIGAPSQLESGPQLPSS